MKCPSPEYVACAVTGEPDGGTAGATLQVATPPVMGTVFVERPSHWSGSEPLIAKATEPVGVGALDEAPVTFALNVVDVEVPATTKTLVLDGAWDVDPAEAAGNASHMPAPIARTRIVPSARTP